MTGLTYQQTGVNLESSQDVKRRIRDIVTPTHGPEVLAGVGAFGAMYSFAGYDDPVLHGEGREDWPETSQDFAVEMKRLYKTAEYKVYPNDGFYVGSQSNVRRMLSDVADFLDRYLRS